MLVVYPGRRSRRPCPRCPSGAPDHHRGAGVSLAHCRCMKRRRAKGLLHLNRPNYREVLECGRALCTSHILFKPRMRGSAHAKRSVRSAMFVAMWAAGSAKLHRNGIVSLSLRHRQRSVEIKTPDCAAPTELGRETGVVAATNMAFLAELARLEPPKICTKRGSALPQDAGAHAQARAGSRVQSASKCPMPLGI